MGKKGEDDEDRV